MTVEERRARQRAYWAKNREKIAERRRRANLDPERVDALREQDRDSYARNRASVLGRKKAARASDPDRIRSQARASYSRHSDEVKAAVMRRFWRDSPDLEALWRVIEQWIEAKKSNPDPEE